jgi:hypothetical protein
MHGLILGFSLNVAIGSIQVISWTYNAGMIGETFLANILWSTLLGLASVMTLISSFQIVAISTKKIEPKKEENQSAQAIENTNIQVVN